MEFFRFFLPLLWALVIFLLSSLPGTDYPAVVFDYSSWAHWGEFLVLGFLTARAFGRYSFKKLCLVLIICLLYALSDELHQSFVPFRSVSFADWTMDLIGVVMGVVGFWKVGKGRFWYFKS